MIPTIITLIRLIGIMIGAYINTKMIGIMTTKESSKLLKTFATITFVLTIILCLGIIVEGSF